MCGWGLYNTCGIFLVRVPELLVLQIRLVLERVSVHVDTAGLLECPISLLVSADEQESDGEDIDDEGDIDAQVDVQ